MRRGSKALALVALLAGPMAAQAVPVQWAGNGHYYEYVAGQITWDAARAAALGSSHMGMSGYLATITSAEENAFVYSLLMAALGGGFGGGWLGGSDAASEGTWTWVDGPEAGTVFWNGGVGGSSPSYAGWYNGEPNDCCGGEDYLTMTSLQPSGWNDLAANDRYLLTGYFVEYSTVPEPGTVGLLSLGLLGLGFAKRRKLN